MEENERNKEPTRSLVKFTTVGLGNELVIFSSGCAWLLFALPAHCCTPSSSSLQISNWDQKNPLSLSLVDSGVYSHAGASCRCGHSNGWIRDNEKTTLGGQSIDSGRRFRRPRCSHSAAKIWNRCTGQTDRQRALFFSVSCLDCSQLEYKVRILLIFFSNL